MTTAQDGGKVFYLLLADFLKSIAFLEGLRDSAVCPSGGLILADKNRSTRKRSSPSVTLYTTNLTRTCPGLKPILRGGRPATNPLSQAQLERLRLT